MLLGAGEIVVVLAVALMVLGPKKMPEVARKLARFVAQVRRMTDEVRSQVDDALQEPPQVKAPQLTVQIPNITQSSNVSQAAEILQAPDAAVSAPDAPEHHGPATQDPEVP